jgi:histidinol-phosphate aminotransferase
MEHFINEHIRSLPAKVPGQPKSKDMIRLDLGEVPYPPSPRVVQAIVAAATEMNRYPEMSATPLRAALAQYAKVRPEQIVVGNGSDDLIELIVKVFLKPGEEVLLPIPTFFMYTHAVQILGGKPVFVQRRKDFGLDVPSLLNQASPLFKIAFIANPNNPTATLTPLDEIIELLRKLPGVVVVDECYYEMSQQTVADLIDHHPNLIVLRSLSKGFGLAGLRIGYAITNATYADALVRAAQPFAVNRMAQSTALAALDDVDHVVATNARMRADRDNLRQRLAALGFAVSPSATNFLFVDTEPVGVYSKVLVEALKARSILVQDFGLKPGLNAYYFRTAVGTSQENETLLAGLTDALRESK